MFMWASQLGLAIDLLQGLCVPGAHRAEQLKKRELALRGTWNGACGASVDRIAFFAAISYVQRKTSPDIWSKAIGSL